MSEARHALYHNRDFSDSLSKKLSYEGSSWKRLVKNTVRMCMQQGIEVCNEDGQHQTVNKFKEIVTAQNEQPSELSEARALIEYILCAGAMYRCAEVPNFVLRQAHLKFARNIIRGVVEEIATGELVLFLSIHSDCSAQKKSRGQL